MVAQPGTQFCYIYSAEFSVEKFGVTQQRHHLESRTKRDLVIERLVALGRKSNLIRKGQMIWVVHSTVTADRSRDVEKYHYQELLLS